MVGLNNIGFGLYTLDAGPLIQVTQRELSFYFQCAVKLIWGTLISDIANFSSRVVIWLFLFSPIVCEHVFLMFLSIKSLKSLSTILTSGSSQILVS